MHGDAFGCQRRNEGFRATGMGDADAAAVRDGVRLDEGFTATGGGGRRAVVSLAGVRVGGQLSCTGRAAGARPGALALDLGDARVGGLLLSTGFGTALNFDGLTYSETPVPVRRRRSSLLRCTYSA